MSCHRVHHPGQHQPGHCHEQGPEHFFNLLILPECIDNRDGPYIRHVAAEARVSAATGAASCQPSNS